MGKKATKSLFTPQQSEWTTPSTFVEEASANQALSLPYWTQAEDEQIMRLVQRIGGMAQPTPHGELALIRLEKILELTQILLPRLEDRLTQRTS